MTGWANNATFPPGKNASTVIPPIPSPPGPGIDPIIGVGTPRELVGTDPDIKDAANELNLTAKWVISRGGEYFFSPSIPALKEKFAAQPTESQNESAEL